MAGYLKSKRCDRMNRRVHEAMVEHDRQHSFHVYDNGGNHHGAYRTLDEARGCVAFDRLASYSIIYGDWNLVEKVSA